ncbi:MAG: hypothetical protein HY303_02395, partial [Candidatus Wallbacteria bacterium]|nr:hypothetical protein [Candidatus Wallbacteria bacterium]
MRDAKLMLLILAVAIPIHAQSLPRFVDTQGVWTLLARRAAVLDARTPAAYRKGHLAGARNVAWDSFSDPSGPLAKGKLNPDTAVLGRLLGALGVHRDRPVVVYGDPLGGWGEEGRIAWMLEYLGHADVHVLDGGVNAWTAAGGTLSQDVPHADTGTFDAHPNPGNSVVVEDVQKAMAVPGAVILDTRTSEE